MDKEISFAVETDFDAPDETGIREALTQRILQDYPGYKVSLSVTHNCG